MLAGLSWRRGSVEQSHIGCLEHQLLHLLVEHDTQEPVTLGIDLSYCFIVGPSEDGLCSGPPICSWEI
jgi:hypothetical protein